MDTFQTYPYQQLFGPLPGLVASQTVCFHNSTQEPWPREMVFITELGMCRFLPFIH